MIQMQKVIKVGNSLAITLDSQQAQLMNIQIGQQLAVAYKPEKRVISISPQASILKTGKAVTKTEKAAVLSGKVTPEFQKWVEKSLDEDMEAMKRLADL